MTGTTWHPGKVFQAHNQEWQAMERQRRQDAFSVSGVSTSLLGGLASSLASGSRQQREQQTRTLFMHPEMAKQAEQALTAESLRMCRESMITGSAHVKVGWEEPKGILAKLKADFKEWTADVFDFSYCKDVKVNPYEEKEEIPDYLQDSNAWEMPKNIWTPNWGHMYLTPTA